MMPPLLKHALRLLAFTTGLWLLLQVLVAVFDLKQPSQTTIIFGVFLVVGLIGHYLTSMRGRKGNPKVVVVRTLLSIVTRFVIYILITLAIIVSEKNHATENLVLFFALYGPYTAFEIHANHRAKRGLQST